MYRLVLTIVMSAALHAVIVPTGAHAQANNRDLVAVVAPDHDPLFIDSTTVQRRETSVSFKYVLDVYVEFEGKAGWKSNEIEAMLDCAQKTYTIRRVVAYLGPRATGSATGVHSFMAPTPKPQKITPRSTFAHLEEHLCRVPGTKG